MLEKKYKFYLSFENCICTDYVTEKFFELLNYDIIPIVYGGANYSQLAPFHSYINALDFTPETLAQYLKILDANDTLYNEYFWWKDHYRIESGVEQMARHGFCDLCKKLHQDDGVTKYYPELLTDWNPDTVCKQIESWDIPTYPVTRQFLKR
jgi:alpha-1,3-fucosyltransferase